MRIMTTDRTTRRRKAVTPQPAATVIPPKVACALLDEAARGNAQALRELRARLALPGPHAGAAKSQRRGIKWVH
jgi:hypothetical protein